VLLTVSLKQFNYPDGWVGREWFNDLKDALRRFSCIYCYKWQRLGSNGVHTDFKNSSFCRRVVEVLALLVLPRIAKAILMSHQTKYNTQHNWGLMNQHLQRTSRRLLSKSWNTDPRSWSTIPQQMYCSYPSWYIYCSDCSLSWIPSVPPDTTINHIMSASYTENSFFTLSSNIFVLSELMYTTN
jgi:hypothetical protein